MDGEFYDATWLTDCQGGNASIALSGNMPAPEDMEFGRRARKLGIKTEDCRDEQGLPSHPSTRLTLMQAVHASCRSTSSALVECVKTSCQRFGTGSTSLMNSLPKKSAVLPNGSHPTTMALPLSSCCTLQRQTSVRQLTTLTTGPRGSTNSLP